MHIPVLLQEVVDGLDPKPGAFFIDGTIGNAGHARALIKRLEPGGSLLGIDRDAAAVNNLQVFAKGFPEMRKVLIRQANYSDLPALLEALHLPGADGLLLDLGVSSDQLDGEASGFANRGFSFRRDEPLDMRFDSSAVPVSRLLVQLSEADLSAIITEYGEERYAKRIAVAIKAAGKRTPIATTKELADVVTGAVPAGYEHGRIHPATRTFQALRIYANQELSHLERLLEALPQIIRAGGRVAIISFHSLEDRIVKNYFRNYGRQGKAEVITPKPITASAQEMQENPRSRSAKLRILKIL